MFSISQQLTVTDASNDESSRLVDKSDFGTDESVALSSLPSSGTLKQHPESVPLASRESVPLLEERIEVGTDRVGFARFQGHSSRIIDVVARGDGKALSNLLANYMTKVNTIDSQRNTALHHAVSSTCHKSDYSVESFYKCTDLLMNCEQMQVNVPNKKGYTAIDNALNGLHNTCVEHMLKHTSAGRLHLDYYAGDRESTVREIIMLTYPDLQPLLPATLMESMGSSDRDKNLLAANLMCGWP